MMTDPSTTDEKPDIRDEIFTELDRRATHYDTTIRKLAEEVRHAIAVLRREHARLLLTQAIAVVICLALLSAMVVLSGKIVIDIVSILHLAK